MADLVDWRALHGEAMAGVPVLVTGGAGFIGSHLCDALVALGADVVVLDDLSGTGGDAGNVPAGVRLVRGSILDAGLLADAMRGRRVVFHEAALGSVPRSVAEPGLFHEVNVTGTLRVLEAARAGGVERVIFAASSSAYGDTPVLPKHEGMPPSPRSPYAAGKVAGEAMMAAWSAAYGVGTLCLRYFNVFGPRQNANSAYAAVIAAFAEALLGGRRPVIYGDGTQSRDFTHVANAVHANLLAATTRGPMDGAVVNVATGRAVTVNELAAIAARAVGRDGVTPDYRPARAGDVLHSLAYLTVARERLGYEVVVGFERGIEQTLGWYASVR